MKFLLYLMIVSGWVPPCHEGAVGCRPDRHFCFFVQEFAGTPARIFTVTAFFSIEIKRVSRVRFISHASVSVVASWLIEHGGACVEWTQLVNLQRSGSRELIVAGGVRQHRRNMNRGTSGTSLVRSRLRG